MEKPHPPSRVLSWSGGKDAASVLVEGAVDALLTTYDERTGLLPHTAVDVGLARQQARALGLPLWEVAVPDPWDAEEYGRRMGRILAGVRPGGAVLFGDLALEGLRRDREERLRTVGLRAEFPAWSPDTRTRAREIVAAGVSALVVSVDTRAVPASLLGTPYDEALLDSLPAGVDPCGENGELQTFVVDHPRFDRPVAVELGPVVTAHEFAMVTVRAPAAPENPS